MKNIFFTTFFCLYSIANQGQTKQETEKWILDKLKEYSFIHLFSEKGLQNRIYYSHQEFDYRFSILNGKLTVKYKCKITNSNGKDWDINTGDYKYKISTSNEKYEIPLNAIRKISFSKYSIKESGSPPDEYEHVYWDAICIDYSDGLHNKDKNVTIGTTDKVIEDNLIERLNNAFDHLKSFYPIQKKETEPF